MKVDLDIANVATWLVVIYAVLGAAVVVLSAADVVGDPQLRLSFENYLSQMAIATGGLAIGRGLAARTRRRS